MEQIITPYETIPPAFCYPGTRLVQYSPEFLGQILIKHINMIGTHTIGITSNNNTSEGEGGFELPHEIERWCIWHIAKQFYKQKNEDVKDIIDGHFCTGGTEANLEGLWIAREYLQPNVNILMTELSHYSIAKSINILNLTEPTIIETNNKFEMDIGDLEKKMITLIDNGEKSFLIILAVGTTSTGSVDDIHNINEKLLEFKNKYTDINIYIHVDASFGGFTLPYLTNGITIGFENELVMSIAIDGHKMGNLPYPGCIILYRKNLHDYVSRRVNYIKGHMDSTIAGSRSFIAQACYYYLHNNTNFNQKKYVTDCINYKNILIEKIIEQNNDRITILPHSEYVNILPLKIDVKDGKIPDELLLSEILKNYQLRNDIVKYNDKYIYVYKICIMPHTFNYIEKFVDNIIHVIKNNTNN